MAIDVVEGLWHGVWHNMVEVEGYKQVDCCSIKKKRGRDLYLLAPTHNQSEAPLHMVDCFSEGIFQAVRRCYVAF